MRVFLISNNALLLAMEAEVIDAWLETIDAPDVFFVCSLSIDFPFSLSDNGPSVRTCIPYVVAAPWKRDRYRAPALRTCSPGAASQHHGCRHLCSSLSRYRQMHALYLPLHPHCTPVRSVRIPCNVYTHGCANLVRLADWNAFHASLFPDPRCCLLVPKREPQHSFSIARLAN